MMVGATEESKHRDTEERKPGPTASTTVPYPQFPRSIWILPTIIIAAAQTFPHSTPHFRLSYSGWIPIIQEEACQDILLGFVQGLRRHLSFEQKEMLPYEKPAAN